VATDEPPLSPLSSQWMKWSRHDAIVFVAVLLPIALLVGVIAWGSFSSGSGTQSLPSGGQAVTGQHGEVLVVLPDGWKHDAQDPGPVRLLTAWTRAKFPSIDCQEGPQLDVRLQIEDVTSSTRSGSLEYKPRRFDYDSKSGTGIPSESGDEFNCGERAQGIGFTQNGRDYAVSVFVAAHPNKQHLAEAYQILNSMKLT
jgi:hypothetical protein